MGLGHWLLFNCWRQGHCLARRKTERQTDPSELQRRNNPHMLLLTHRERDVPKGREREKEQLWDGSSGGYNPTPTALFVSKKPLASQKMT